MTTTGTETGAPPERPARARPCARWLDAPCDPAGLAALRILLGLVLTGAVVRFVARGWVRELYLDPPWHFTYLGFAWVRPWPPWGTYLHFALMGLAALALALGAATRVAALVFFLLFTYAELIEKASYLNHYYFVSLVALLFVFLPAGATASIDAWRRRGPPVQVGRWAYTLVRAQVAVVYLYAGLAKLNPDWLGRAQPLSTWLRARADLPWVGPWLATPVTAAVMSWAGAAFDLGIVGLLAWRRTRALGFAAAVLFHTAIWCLFPIGVFSWVMLASITIFFAPDWPRRLARRWGFHAAASPREPAAPRPLSRMGRAAFATHLAVQVLVPLRFLLYPGDVNWTEQGFRFAWRVMLVEKTGQVEYEVVTATPPARFRVLPSRELTPLQYKAMSTQPDMIHEYALALAERYRRRGFRGVKVHAHAHAAMNLRPSQRLIDPSFDLAAYPRRLTSAPWIVPLLDPAEPAP